MFVKEEKAWLDMTEGRVDIRILQASRFQVLDLSTFGPGWGQRG